MVQAIQIEKELHELKQDIAVIKHILSEEGRPNEHAKKALNDARQTPDNEYISHEELKKRVQK